MRERAVAVCIVSHNSAADLANCLKSVGKLDYQPLSAVVVDCASSDDSVNIAKRKAPPNLDCRVVALEANLGFAGGMNVAFRETDTPYVLTLNPDARPDRDFVTRLVERIESHPDRRIGAVTGRLVRPADQEQPKLDACGMYLSPTWRHLDRGSGVTDRGQWTTPQRVFGATAAAALYTRRALADTTIDGEFFAAEFHSYREDAELCFRLCERDWEVVYEPRALCEHRRTNVPGRRHDTGCRRAHRSCSASTIMNLIWASAASLEPTNARHFTVPVRAFARMDSASRTNWSPGTTG